MKIDWKLTGNNLFHFNCSKDAVIHPETCITQVLTTHDGNSTLNDWITTDSDNTSYELKSSLMDWLQTYYSLSTQLGFTGIPGLDDTNSIILGDISVGDDPTVYMRAPFGSVSTAGVLKVNTSKGLTVANGILNINSASNSSFGVIKTGYPESGNNKPVLLDNNGNAYVDISGGTAQATIGGWNFNGTIAELDPAPIMYFNTGDAFASIDLSNYVSQITSVFTGTPDSYKFYPVRTDIDGRAYVYVPWNSVTYRTFTSNVDGLVPAPGISSNKQYLRADGTWGEVPYPSRFTLNNDGLVNYPTAANQYNFLRGDGSWQDVTAAFTGATTTQNGVKGMVPAPAVADKEKFLRGDGAWSTLPVATDSSIGGIKTGYTKDGNKKPVQIVTDNTSEDYLKAFVDTESHLVVGGMITNGLSAHFFRVGTGTNAGSFTQNTWVPILISNSTNIGKCSVEFEIFGREDGKTSYGKYYVNHMSNVTNKLLCLSFWTEDTNHFDYDDVRVAKYAESNNNVTIVVYKKVKNVGDSMFIVNILAENDTGYSVQHYFYTNSSSTHESGYQLYNNDLRIGTLNTDTMVMTARLENSSEATVREMNTIGATNATSYTTT